MTETELLVATADDHLAAEVARLAAAAGPAPLVVDRVDAALRHWVAAGTVLVGTDLAAQLAGLGPPRRERVHLVGFAEAPVRDALACSAESVLVLPGEGDRLVRLLSDAADGSVAQAQVVGVVGGAGGAGATVFAAALAEACAARGSTVLVDVDRLGAGVDQVLGLDTFDGIRWDALLHADGRLGARALRESLPRRGELAVLAWPHDPVPLGSATLRETLSALRRGFGTVVLALPRHPDPLGEELRYHCDRLLLVSTCTLMAVLAARRVLDRLPRERCALVLRGGERLPPEEVAAYLSLPIAVSMTNQRGLDEALTLGAGPLARRGSLSRAAHRVAARLGDGR